MKIRFQPGGAGRQLEQLLIEHRTKKQRADIINTPRSYVGVMAKAGAVIRYRTPLRAALRDGFTDKEGFINGIYAQPRVFLYNTRMIARDKAPQSFEDLLDPRWKDKSGMDTTDYDWLASPSITMGAARLWSLPESWPSNSSICGVGRLCWLSSQSGEFPVVVNAFPEEIMQMKNAKAPGGIRLYRAVRGGQNADHGFDRLRCAASARGGAVLSKPGQDLMAGQGRWVSRKDGNYFADFKGKKMQIPSLEWDDKQVELIKLYNSIFSLS